MEFQHFNPRVNLKLKESLVLVQLYNVRYCEKILKKRNIMAKKIAPNNLTQTFEFDRNVRTIFCIC